MTSLAILGGYGLSVGRRGRRDSPPRRVRGLDRLLHPVRGRFGGGQTPGKRIVGHPGRDGHGARRHARRGRGAQPAPGRRLSPAALSDRRPARRLSSARQASRRSRGRHGRGAGPAARAAPPARPPRRIAARRRRFPSSTTRSSASSRSSSSARRSSTRPRGHGWPAPSVRPHRRDRSAPPGLATWRICWCCTRASWPVARDASRRGAPRESAPASRRRSARGGTQFERLAERAAREGLDSFGSHELPDFAARYREVAADLARARTYRADEADSGTPRTAGSGRPQRALPGRAGHVAAALGRAGARVPGGDHRGAPLRPRRVPRLHRFPPRRGSRSCTSARPWPPSCCRTSCCGEPRPDGTQGRPVAATWRSRPRTAPLMASGIITNNVRVAIACFAGGIFLGVGSLVLLALQRARDRRESPATSPTSGCSDYLLDVHPRPRGARAVRDLGGGRGGVPARTNSSWLRVASRRADALVVSGRQAVRMLGA